MTNSGTQLGPNPKAQPGPNYLPPRFRNLLLHMTAIRVLVFVFRTEGPETSVGDSWVLVGSYLGPSLALAPPAKPYSRHPPSRKPLSKNSPLRGDPTKWIWVEFRCNLFEAGRSRGTLDQASKQQIFKHKNVETRSGPTLGLRVRVWFCKQSLL